MDKFENYNINFSIINITSKSIYFSTVSINYDNAYFIVL